MRKVATVLCAGLGLVGCVSFGQRADDPATTTEADKDDEDEEEKKDEDDEEDDERNTTVPSTSTRPPTTTAAPPETTAVAEPAGLGAITESDLETLLLNEDDFDETWVTTSEEPLNSPELVAGSCAGDADFTPYEPGAQSLGFFNDDGFQIYEFVGIDSDSIPDRLDGLESEAGQKCISGSAVLDFLTVSEFEIGETRVEPLDITADGGDRTVALRVFIPATSEDGTVEFNYDYVAVQVGDSLVMLTFVGVNGLFDDLDRRYTDLAVDRVAQGLSAFQEAAGGGASTPAAGGESASGSDGIKQGGVYFSGISPDDFPAGEPNEVSIVANPSAAYGPLTSFALVRNNTGENVSFVRMNTISKDSSGDTIEERTAYASPKTLEPGQIGFANMPVYLGEEEIAEWELEVESFQDYDLANFTLEVVRTDLPAGVTAVVKNTSDQPVSADLGATLYCFDQNGAPTELDFLYVQNIEDVDADGGDLDLAPGDELTYEWLTPGDQPCQSFAIETSANPLD